MSSLDGRSLRCGKAAGEIRPPAPRPRAKLGQELRQLRWKVETGVFALANVTGQTCAARAFAHAEEEEVKWVTSKVTASGGFETCLLGSFTAL